MEDQNPPGERLRAPSHLTPLPTEIAYSGISAMPKHSIRREMLVRRRQMSVSECLAWSLQAQQRFLELPEFRSARSLALYSPFRNEVFTEEIFRRARLFGKRVAYPRVGRAALEFVEVEEASDLRPGAFGILEPAAGRTVDLDQLELMAVPGLAFDLEGYRLGYGQGFYDRVLHGALGRVILVGLCFELQLVSALPAEDHDIPMDLIVTEARTHLCPRASGSP